jgi:hypothetical protein
LMAGRFVDVTVDLLPVHGINFYGYFFQFDQIAAFLILPVQSRRIFPKGTFPHTTDHIYHIYHTLSKLRLYR